MSIQSHKTLRVLQWLAGACVTGAVLGALPSAFAANLPPRDSLHAVQHLTRGNGAEPETLDPALGQSVGASNIIRDLLEGLTAVSAEGEIVPGMAERWERVDPLTWRFHLRQASWSNGDPVTADDFVFGWRRFFDPKTASVYASTFQNFILNARAIVNGEHSPDTLGVTAVAPGLLEVRTEYPVPFLTDVLSHTTFAPVNRRAVETFGAQWTRPENYVSNGAFVLKEWRVNSRIVLARHDNYWDAENVALTQVVYLPVDDEGTDVKLFLSGESDYTNSLPPGTFEQHHKQRPAELRNSRALGLRYYSLNTEDPLLKDMRVRQALSMVIDRELLAGRVLADGQVPAYGLMVEGLQGTDVVRYDWADWPMDKRVETARALLKEAGVAPGTTLSFAYNTSDYHKRMALFVASEWKTKLGLNTQLENMEFHVLLKRRNEGEYQAARDGWLSDYADATSMLTVVRCDSAQNSTRYCDRDAEALLIQAQTADGDERRALHTRAAHDIMEGYPMIPLTQYTHPRLIKTYVGGYSESNAMDRYRSRDLYIKKH